MTDRQDQRSLDRIEAWLLVAVTCRTDRQRRESRATTRRIERVDRTDRIEVAAQETA